MRNKELIAALTEWGRQSKKIEISPNHIEAMWTNLRVKIAAERVNAPLVPHKARGSLTFGTRFFSTPVLRPVLAGALIVSVALSGWVTTVNAALGSVPGDVLYSVKRASEKMQVTLATDKKTETRLRAEFTGRRAEEMTKIANRENGQKSEQVAKIAEALTKEITVVKSQLEAMKGGEPADAAEVAQIVDQNATVAARALEFSSTGLSEAGRFAVAEAKSAVADAAIAATEVIVGTHLAGVSGVSAGTVRSTVDDRIRSFEAQMSGAASALQIIASTSTLPAPAFAPAKAATQVAQGALQQARSSLAHDDFAGALLKVKEVRELASAAEKKVEEVKEAAKESEGSLPAGDLSKADKSGETLPQSPAGTEAGQASQTAPTRIIAPKPADEPILGVTSGSTVSIDFQIEE